MMASGVKCLGLVNGLLSCQPLATWYDDEIYHLCAVDYFTKCPHGL